MNVLIIEDEQAAAENLKYLLKEIDPSITVETVIDTVVDAVDFFNKEHSIALAFFDIHLADGISFEIFEKVQVNVPIIFTTAFDEYAIKAFKVNSVDYLLKPIDEEELKDAIDKYKSTRQASPINEQFQQMLQLIKSEQKSFKNTYLVQQRDTLIPLNVDDVAYFTIDDSIVKAVVKDNKSFIIDKKLEDIETELNPALFFRANRQFIVNRNAIENLQLYFNGKLILNVNPKSQEQIVVSKAKAPQLKNWMHHQ
ncbi:MULTISPECIES: LytR/AlgR family response regulator transcription factor [unclassified Tenacibaculum]|uniref:LytR/AlgR family response regulator transcription factor n=1 Tax=unclassified Tenacibaculum TaxID=2635139 RepID=UPI001F22D070|nr:MULTISPECIES: LytTR family DNA-binding domain-containing protein [unclassified Tenacibaculum]MCF2875790.1 LytTR family DNA-binding domain-containing protein [Tenacibaculum sp. Cn5-1]MCF2935866.1 LytTR family DNA-binding domain-containing protein [Tenacibaculum sp. Cn5-34]MCG7512426.1 LytTR family DNA-binding domain-containing protein [Tenacibaculum sp. Cn5-46]